MTCSRCGAAVADGAAFCSACGLNVTRIGVAVATPPGTFGGATIPGLSPVATGDVLARLRAALAPRYAVEREVGRGGMAVVFLAHDAEQGRDVAIKVLHPELAATLGGDRFQREIRVARALEHPHILGMLDAGVADGLLYYVMPFVTGESLRDRLAREGQLPIADALAITRAVAGALDHAHAQGFVHRDIKPENILLQDGRAMVADFGIARALSEAETQKLTQTGMAVGTPVYMSPEQAVGEKVGPAADVYSLGCVLFEMLAGEAPFTGSNGAQIMARHALEPPRSIRVVRASVPEHVEEAIFAALEKSPADRPKSAAAFAALLDASAAADGRTPAAQRRTTVAGARYLPPPPRRSPLPAILGVLVLLLVGAGVGWRAGWFERRPGVLDASARRVAVLYFDDRSPKREFQPLADGLTEGLIDALATAPTLNVVSRTGVERYRGSTLPVDSIARALRAGYVVRGSVEPEGSDVRVTLGLADATGAPVGDAQTFVRPARGLLALRDTLGAAAAELLKRELGAQLELKSLRASTGDADAWLLVQRGEQLRRRADSLVARGDSAGYATAFRSADSLYVAAAARDGRWVTPLVQRAALAYRRSRVVGRDPAAIRPWVDTGLVRVATALGVDPRSADALELRGNLRYWSWLNTLDPDPARQQARLDSARKDFEQATTLAPRQAGAWASLSHLLSQVATPAEVQLAAERALEADEFLGNADVILGRIFTSLYDQVQFDRAKQRCGELMRRFPTNPLATRCQLYLLTTRLETPDVARAWRLADSTVALAPAPRRPALRLYVDMLVAAVIARAGKTTPALVDSGRAVVRRSEGDPSIDPAREAAFIGAWSCKLLGDADCAIRLLRQYLVANPGRQTAFQDDPGWWFRDLADDPRFQQLVGGTQ